MQYINSLIQYTARIWIPSGDPEGYTHTCPPSTNARLSPAARNAPTTHWQAETLKVYKVYKVHVLGLARRGGRKQQRILLAGNKRLPTTNEVWPLQLIK